MKVPIQLENSLLLSSNRTESFFNQARAAFTKPTEDSNWNGHMEEMGQPTRPIFGTAKDVKRVHVTVCIHKCARLSS